MKNKLLHAFMKGMASIFLMDANLVWQQYLRFRNRTVADGLGGDWRKIGKDMNNALSPNSKK